MHSSFDDEVYGCTGVCGVHCSSGLVGAVLTALRVHDTKHHGLVRVPLHPAAGGGWHGRGGQGARDVQDCVVVPLLCVVGRWAWDHALRAALGADGACERLLHLVSLHADEERPVELALAALHALAWNPENKVRLAEAPPARGMGLVVQALERFPRAQALHLQAVSIVSIMSYYSDLNKALLHRCVHVCGCIYIYIHIYIYVCVCVCIYIYMYVCIYIYIRLTCVRHLHGMHELLNGL